jgi:hypothetical protein
MTSKPSRLEIVYAQRTLIRTEQWRCCMNCENWSNNSVERKNTQPSEICHKFNARPPAETITLGCIEWETIIPF